MAACGKPAALPASPPTVKVDMAEYRFSYNRKISPGRVVFRIANKGKLVHRMILTPWPANLAPIQQELHNDKPNPITPIAGIDDRPPGTEGFFAVDLTPGKYAMLCLFIDPDKQAHALKGMASEFTVSGGAQGGPGK